MRENKSNFIKALRLATVGVALFAFSGGVLADQYDDQIAALQRQAAEAKAVANTYSAIANDYQSKVNQLNAQINSIQADIDLNQAKYQKLTAEIADNTQKIAVQKEQLGENLRVIYTEGQVSTLEMLVSSDGLADYLDRRQALQTVKDKIVDSLATIQALKAKLEADQSQTQTILSEEKAQQDQIAAQQAQSDSLLALAEQNESAANQQVQQANSQINSLRAAQAESFARLHFSSNGAGSDGSLQFRNLSFGGACGGGYPSSLCGYATDSEIDQWNLYNRECVSYAAWAMQYRYGHDVGAFHGDGNAYEWPYTAPRHSNAYTDGNPSVGSVAIAGQGMIGGVGHAMVVESILGGGWIHVSQYNWWPTANGPYGLYSTMDVKTAGLQFVHFN